MRNKTYPKGILKEKGKNLIPENHAKTSALSMEDLMYKEKQRVVFEVERRTSSNVNNAIKTIYFLTKRFYKHK